MTRLLDQIRYEVELEGFTPGTEVYERVLLGRRVEKCQELQSVQECVSCRAFLDCGLARKHMLNKQMGGETK